jgi:tetratricopeptide (TPR) repeat protein
LRGADRNWIEWVRAWLGRLIPSGAFRRSRRVPGRPRAGETIGIGIDCTSCGRANTLGIPDLVKPELTCRACSAALVQGVDYPSIPRLVDYLVQVASTKTLSAPAEALGLLLEALKLDEWNAQAHNLAGVVYNEAGESERAIFHLSRALDLDPSFSKHHFDLGLAYVQIDDFPEAARHFERALDIFPDYLSAMLNLGVCYFAAGDRVAAALVFDRVSALDREGEPGRRAREALRAVREAPGEPVPTDAAPLATLFEAFTHEVNRDFEAAYEAYSRVLAGLPGGGPAYSIVCQYLANDALCLDRHVDCMAHAEAARRGLPCARAIAQAPVQPVTYPGMYQDADELCRGIVRELLGARHIFLMRSWDPSDPGMDVMVMADGEEYLLRRAGNIFRIKRGEAIVAETMLYENQMGIFIHDF